MFKEDSSGSSLLIIGDHEGATVVAKGVVDFFDDFGKCFGFVVLSVAEGVSRAIEEGVFFPGMAVEVKVHHESIFSLEFIC